MNIQRIEREEVAARAVTALGLDASTVDISSTEGLCASLRRAASFLCPATPRQLIDVVLQALTPIGYGVEREVLQEELGRLISIGDLLELCPSESRTRLLYLGPPSYVEKAPGDYLLIGIRPNAEPILDEAVLGSAVTYEGHTRSIDLDSETALESLSAAGLHRLTPEQWTRSPRQEPAAVVIGAARDRLAADRMVGSVTGLTIIDPDSSNLYYRGRWREPSSDDHGIFVGRRPQAYGSPIWCAVELVNGIPQSFIDFPLASMVVPGWDEARQLQAALDAESGTPQVFGVRTSLLGDGTHVFDFFAPLPSWAERYLNLIGVPITRSPRALFSYRIQQGAEKAAIAFLSESLWMIYSEEPSQS